ncbi:MAG: hypothetical protein OYH77_02390 [Pseudomonadota bacterium]|nr:hypothetical protein [Pseudomonadota bacterium]
MSDTHLTTLNYTYCYYVFRSRQAGVTAIYDPTQQLYVYNSYCLEQKLLKEIYSIEFGFLDDALAHINTEFGNWEFRNILLKKPACNGCDNAQ